MVESLSVFVMIAINTGPKNSVSCPSAKSKRLTLDRQYLRRLKVEDVIKNATPLAPNTTAMLVHCGSTL